MATRRKPKRGARVESDPSSARPARRPARAPRAARPVKKTAAKRAAAKRPAKKAAKRPAKKSAAVKRPAKKSAAAKRPAKKSAATTRPAVRPARRPASAAAIERARVAAAEEAKRERARERARARREAAKAESERLAKLEEKARKKRNAAARRRRAEAKAAAEEEERRAEARRAAARRRAKERKKARAEEERRRLEAQAAVPASRRQYPEQPMDGYHRIDVLGRVRQSLDELEAERRKKYGKEVAEAARRLEESLEFVKSNLVVDGWLSKVLVHANDDKTVDGDLSIDFAPGQMTKRLLTERGGLLTRLEEHLGQVLNTKLAGFWLQYGFYLPAESQVQQATEARRPYKPYEGALRFGYGYLKVSRVTGAFVSPSSGQTSATFVGLNIQASETLNAVLNGHKRPPTGMYVRFHWSKDGQLHRRR